VKGEPEWLSLEDALLFHGQLVGTFGGAGGLRDQGLLESALSRPRHEFAYGSRDLFVLAGAYAHGIVKNHPFVDGNERMAFVIARIFLAMNGVGFEPPQHEAVVMIEGLASTEVRPDEFVSWLRKHSTGKRRRRR
jgi:death-on-curing protein